MILIWFSLVSLFNDISSKVSDRIFEIHQLWQSGFSRVYSNSCCSCSFEREIIKIGQSSYKIYCNNIVNFQESTTILNAYLETYWRHHVYCHLQTDCFVLSQLIGVVRHVRYFKLGSKPGWFYGSWISNWTTIGNLSVREGDLTYMYHFSFVYIYA